MERHECCLFHGKKHKSDFQFILNFLRKNCVEVKIDFARAAQLVCCCKLDHESGCNTSNLNLLSGKDTSTEDQEMGLAEDKDLCKEQEQDWGIKSVLGTKKIPGKVKVILEKWMKRNSDAESHVHYGNSRVSALMMLCLEGDYKPLQKMMVERGSREHVAIVPIPCGSKLVKPFFELDMKEKQEKLDFTFEVVNSRLAGLSINETFVKVTCDKENIEAVKILLVKEAKALVMKEKKAAKSALTDSGTATSSPAMLKATAQRMTKAMLGKKSKRMKMS